MYVRIDGMDLVHNGAHMTKFGEDMECVVIPVNIVIRAPTVVIAKVNLIKSLIDESLHFQLIFGKISGIILNICKWHTFFAANVGVKNEGQDCWGGCKQRQGRCQQFCGDGLCCRYGWGDTSGGCDGTVGIPGKGHVCAGN